MKTGVMITLGAALLISTNSFAQNMPAVKSNEKMQVSEAPKLTLEQRVEREVGLLDAKVHLTADQKTKMTQLFTTTASKRDANRVAAGEDTEKLKTLNMALIKEKRAAMNKILSTEQQAILKESRQTSLEQNNGAEIKK